MELVKSIYRHAHKMADVYTIGKDLWNKVKKDDNEYHRVANELKNTAANQKKTTTSF